MSHLASQSIGFDVEEECVLYTETAPISKPTTNSLELLGFASLGLSGSGGNRYPTAH